MADAGAGDRDAAVADDDEVGREPALAGPAIAGSEHVGRLARLERADEQQVRRPAVDRRARPRTLGAVEQRPGGDHRRVHAPGARDVRAQRVRVAHDGGGPLGEPAGAGEAVPRALVGREVARALLERAVVDGQHERDAGRHRERRGRRHPHDVDAAEQPVEARAARDGGRAEQHAAGQRVPDDPDTFGNRAQPVAARDEREPLVLRVRGGERAEQRARVTGDAAPGREVARVHSDPHARGTITRSPAHIGSRASWHGKPVLR